MRNSDRVPEQKEDSLSLAAVLDMWCIFGSTSVARFGAVDAVPNSDANPFARLERSVFGCVGLFLPLYPNQAMLMDCSFSLCVCCPFRSLFFCPGCWVISCPLRAQASTLLSRGRGEELSKSAALFCRKLQCICVPVFHGS